MKRNYLEERENLYRPGVLIGNWVEEKLRDDRNAKTEPLAPRVLSEAQEQFSDPRRKTGTSHRRTATVEAKRGCFSGGATEEIRLKDQFVLESLDRKGAVPESLPHHLFFGHGLRIDDFHKRELISTNTMSYGLRMQPTTFLKRGVPAETKLQELVKTGQDILKKENVYPPLPKDVDFLKRTKVFSRKFDLPQYNLHLRS